jgi:hypothetical protein
LEKTSFPEKSNCPKASFKSEKDGGDRMNEPTKREPTPFERLRDFARRIVAVPKEEIDQQEAEYQRQRKKRKEFPQTRP